MVSFGGGVRGFMRGGVVLFGGGGVRGFIDLLSLELFDSSFKE